MEQIEPRDYREIVKDGKNRVEYAGHVCSRITRCRGWLGSEVAMVCTAE